MAGEHIDGIVEEYADIRDTYKGFAERLAALLEELLEGREIPYQSVQWRAKDLDSFRRKIMLKPYDDPFDEVHDLSGIRIIVYTDSDREAVRELIADELKVHEEHSVDKDAELGRDRVGYRAWHYICDVGSRGQFQEWEDFAHLVCEVQVTTVLGHAWSEVEHDRNYKSSGDLPGDLERRFNLLAGLLELADRELDALDRDAEASANRVQKIVNEGTLSLPTTTTSFAAYIKSRFPKWTSVGLQPSFNTPELEHVAIDLLERHGLGMLSAIAQVLPGSYDAELCEVAEGDLWTAAITVLLLHAPGYVLLDHRLSDVGMVLTVGLSECHAKWLAEHGVKLKRLIDLGLVEIEGPVATIRTDSGQLSEARAALRPSGPHGTTPTDQKHPE